MDRQSLNSRIAAGRRPVGLAFALAFLLLGCGGKSPVDLLLRDLTVLDLDTGQAESGQAVAVRDGLVQAIVPMGRVDEFDAASVVDGAGGFLMPALADAHVHLSHPSELDSYLRYGVGLVVNMSGRRSVLEMRQALAANRLDGPAIVTAGPTLDGAPPTNPLFTSVGPETAAEIVAWIDDQGYDLVKVYQQMNGDALRAVIAAASRRQLITAGHVSRSAGIEGTLGAGLRYVAHGEELAFESFDETSRRFDRGEIPALAALVARHGVTVTPMISYLENVPRQVLALDEVLDAEPMSRLPAAMLLSFGARQGWFSSRPEPAAFAEQMADAAGFVARLTAELDGRGVPLVLGTDAGFGGAIPGYAVHQELESLVGAGLTELAALRTATRNVGRYLRQIDPSLPSWGRIEPGAGADLLLLEANPLEEISATRRIAGVARAGRWYGREQLAAIDRRLRDRQAALLPLARAFETALVDGDVEAARRALDSRPAELGDESLIRPDNCLFLGYRHYYGGRRELAGRLYEICAEMHPDSSPLWLHIGRAREESGDRPGARDAYRRALAENPWYGDPAAAMRRLEEVSG